MTYAHAHKLRVRFMRGVRFTAIELGLYGRSGFPAQGAFTPTGQYSSLEAAASPALTSEGALQIAVETESAFVWPSHLSLRVGRPYLAGVRNPGRGQGTAHDRLAVRPHRPRAPTTT